MSKNNTPPNKPSRIPPPQGKSPTRHETRSDFRIPPPQDKPPTRNEKRI